MSRLRKQRREEKARKERERYRKKRPVKAQPETFTITTTDECENDAFLDFKKLSVHASIQPYLTQYIRRTLLKCDTSDSRLYLENDTTSK